jgi:hypothetical protein
MDNLISRKAAIYVMNEVYRHIKIIKKRPVNKTEQAMYLDMIGAVKSLPSVQPEITDEQAIGHLQASGWMKSHDKQMYEMGLKEGLADDSDSYDALLPSSQPETNYSEVPNTSDFVSRKAVREMVATWSYDMAEWEDMELALHDVDELPPAKPEVIHCKDCDLWHIAGCPMNIFVEKPEPGYFCGTAKRKEK